MADHAVEVQLFYGGMWQAVPAYVRDGITLSRGAPGEGQEAPPSTAAVTLDNRTGAYSPLNVAGALYGLMGRNTPLRVVADGGILSTTEVASWGTDRTLKGSSPDKWTTVQGAGILRRLQQGRTPLRGPLERAILADGPHVWWPLTEGREAAVFLSGLPGGQPLTIAGLRPGEIPGPVGSGAVFPDVAYRGVVQTARGQLPAGLSPSGWGLECIVYIGGPVSAGDAPAVTVLQWEIGGSGTWELEIGVDSVGPYVIAFGNIGATGAGVFRTSSSVPLAYGWHHIRLVFQQTGANVDQDLFVDGVNLGTTDNTSTAGTLGAPTGDVVVGQAETNPFWARMDQAGVGQVAFWSLANANVDRSDAAFGHIGEPAGDRFLRILDEEGILGWVIGTASDTQSMGPQGVDTLLNVVRECVRTDDGLLFEPVDERALVMRTNRSLYNQTSAMTIDFAGGGVAPGFVPVLDDAYTRNDVTASRRGGGSARLQQLSGPLNVNDPISDELAVGRYEVSIEVNPETDGRLVDHAGWHLGKGTVDGPRFPSITLDLDAAPSMIAAVGALEIGDRITITNLPDEWQPGDEHLILLGVRDRFPAGAGDFRRLVTLNARPADPYDQVGIVGANDGSTNLRGQAVDTDLSIVASAVGGAATSISVISTGGVLWTTSAADWNPALNGGGLYIVIAGEEMRVTNIVGATSPQTFTVVRSTNGVVKAHLFGESVHVANPIRVGL